MSLFTILPVLSTLQCLKSRCTDLGKGLARKCGHDSECEGAEIKAGSDRRLIDVARSTKNWTSSRKVSYCGIDVERA
jgi:hypothetical protein